MLKFGKRLFTLLLMLGLLSNTGLVQQTVVAQDGQEEFVTRPNSEDLLPETTVLYVQIENVRDFVEKMGRTKGGELLRNEQIAALTGDLMTQARDAYSQVEEQVGLSLDEIKSLPAGEVVFAMIAPKRELPVFLAIVEVGTKNEAVKKALDRGREFAEEQGAEIESEEAEEVEDVVFESIGQGDNRFTYFQKDGVLVGSNDRTELENVLKRWTGVEIEKDRPLSKNRKFITIMNRCRGTKETPPELRMYLDPIELARSANRRRAGAQLMINFLPVLGLDGLLAVGGSSIMFEEEFESVFHGHLLLANPRKGILEMVALKPGDYRPETWVPNNVVNYMTTSWDIPKLFTELTTIVDTFMGEGALETQIQENINDEIGINLYDDLLMAFDGRVSYLQWIEPPSRFNSQVNGVGLGLKDKDKFLDVLEKVFARITEESGEENPMQIRDYRGVTIWSQPDEQVERQSERLRELMEERDQAMVEIRQAQPAFAIINDVLVFSDSLKFIEMAIDTDRGDNPSLVTDERFKLISNKISRILKTDAPCAVFYSQPEDVMRMLFEAVSAEDTKNFLDRQSENVEFLKGIKRAMDENPLPDFEDVKHLFQPSGAFITTDETGYHMFGFQLRDDSEDKESKTNK